MATTREAQRSFIQDGANNLESLIETLAFARHRLLSKQDQVYKLLDLSIMLEGLNLENLNHQQIGIVTYQSHTYITYLEKDPLEVDSLNKTLLLHLPYKKPLHKQASVLLYRLKALRTRSISRTT